MKEREELERYLREIERRRGSVFNIEEICFDKQIAFITDPAPFKTACCGGRAGKTVADAVYLLQAARSRPRGVALYLTLSRINAKKLVWPELLELNRRYKLGGKVNESDLSIQFDNGSFIYVSGASTRDEIEKFRGLPLILCIIDEVQSFKPYVESLIDDVVSKRLFDFAGTLALTGTPGPVPAGYFFDACHSHTYAHFAWTMFDNPHIAIKSGMTHQALLDREMNRKGVTIDDPSIQREVFGKWVLDVNVLVFKYDKVINHYTERPRGKYTFILGIDLGFDDADALAVLAWSDTDPTTYLVEEVVKTKQGITELVKEIERLKCTYDISKIVMDAGGLGKKISEEIVKRYTIHVEPAEKVRKFENIELMNDSLRTGKLKAARNSRFAQDCMLVEWDLERSTPERKVVSARYHSDICDAVLYAWRESYSFTSKIPVEKPKYLSPAWAEAETKRMEEEAEEYFKKLAEMENEQTI